MQKRRNSSALAMELRLFCIKPSIHSLCHNNVVKFLQNPQNKQTLHSSPMRARYGMTFVILNYDLCPAFVEAVHYVLPYHIILDHIITALDCITSIGNPIVERRFS